MTFKAGVWIDHHKAVVVLLTEEGQDMVQILPGGHVSARSPSGLRAKNSYTPNDFVEGKLMRQEMIHVNEYYDEVIACVREAQAILILGPGETKGALRKRIANQKLKGHIAEMKTADKPTDGQIADYVRQHFQ